jgi:hypothetical protein
VGGDLTGFVVDGVSEVIRIPASEVQPPPTMMAGSIEQSYLTGVFNHAGQLLIIMDLERMFTAAERDALAEWSWQHTAGEENGMIQEAVERLLGRLLTDDRFRRSAARSIKRFSRDPDTVHF